MSNEEAVRQAREALKAYREARQERHWAIYGADGPFDSKEQADKAHRILSDAYSAVFDAELAFDRIIDEHGLDADAIAQSLNDDIEVATFQLSGEATKRDGGTYVGGARVWLSREPAGDWFWTEQDHAYMPTGPFVSEEAARDDALGYLEQTGRFPGADRVFFRAATIQEVERMRRDPPASGVDNDIPY